MLKYRLLFFLLFFISSNELFGQIVIPFHVKTLNYYTHKKESGVTIKVFEGDVLDQSSVSTASGDVLLELEIGKRYKIEMSKDGKIPRFVYVNFQDVTKQILEDGVEPIGGLDMSLFENLPTVDYSYVLANAATEFTYDPTIGLQFDETMALRTIDVVDRIMKQNKAAKEQIAEKERVEEEKRLAIAEKQAKIEIEEALQNAKQSKQHKIDSLIALGNDLVMNNKFPEARKFFVEASKIDFEQALPKRKIDEIDQLINSQKQEKESQKLAEAKRKQEEEEVKRLAEEQRQKEIAEAKQKQEEEAKRLAEEQHQKEIAEVKRKQEEEAKRLAEEQRQKEIAEAKRKQEEEAKRLAEEQSQKEIAEVKRKKEEESKRLAEEQRQKEIADAKRKQEEEAKLLAEEQRQKEIAEAKRKQEEESKRVAEEEAKRLAEEQRQKEIAEAKRKQEEEAKRLAEEQRQKEIAEAKRKQEEEAKRLAEEQRQKEIAEAKRKQEEEAKRLADEQKKKSDDFKKLLSQADLLFLQKKWDESKKLYESLLTQSPTNTYIKQRISEINTVKNKVVVATNKTPVQNTYNEVAIRKAKDLTEARKLITSIENRDKLFNYQVSKDLANVYEEGVTEEKLTQDNLIYGKNVNLVRRIVVINGIANVYAEFQTHKGMKYSKNGLPATDYIWQKETEDPELKRN